MNIGEHGQISLVNSCNLVCLSLIPLSFHHYGGRCFFVCDPVFFYVSVLLSLFTARALESVHCGLWSFKQNYFQFSTKVCIWQSNKSQLNSIPMFPIFSRRSPISMLTLMRWDSRNNCRRRWRFGRDVELHSGLEQMHFKGTSATSK